MSHSNLWRNNKMALNLSQLNTKVSTCSLNSSRIDRTITNQAVKNDLVCFSHLRWDFVYQRPQHLLSRAARDRRVFFVEEPVFDDGSMRLEIMEREGGVNLVVPHLPNGLHSEVATHAVLREMMDRLIATHQINNFTAWYYTPMAVPFTEHLTPIATVYDCMDELSAFKGAPLQLRRYELTLFQNADLVFTGGQSLYEAKRNQHHSVFAFPSSIDRPHFAQARGETMEPLDQKDLPQPRLGFFGVIDERFDVALLDRLAQARPGWQFVMIGPIVKIDSGVLPRHQNIHYLGHKNYQELPAYLSGWNVALLLFARNEATRFISPTKTPEYLAAGKRVVSTSIEDVVRPYGQEGLVSIADTPEEFIHAVEAILEGRGDGSLWLSQVDRFLAGMSWDETWSRMSRLIEARVAARREHRLSVQPANVSRETPSAIAVGAV
jgi:UDP-galactopyranose mutase